MDEVNKEIIKGGLDLHVGELGNDLEDVDAPLPMYIRKMDSVKPPAVNKIDLTSLPKMLEQIGGSIRVNTL